MDESVIRAMDKWPDVPGVYGWLGLDARGRWRLRGEPVRHAGAVAFINRNYGCEAGGRWYFQNGPQRVYVTLEYTPWIYEVAGDGGLYTHTRASADAVEAVWVDEDGAMLLGTEHGVGVVCDRDLACLCDFLRTAAGGECDDDDLERLLDGRAEEGSLRLDWGAASVPVGRVSRAACPERFGYDPAPSPGD